MEWYENIDLETFDMSTVDFTAMWDFSSFTEAIDTTFSSLFGDWATGGSEYGNFGGDLADDVFGAAPEYGDWGGGLTGTPGFGAGATLDSTGVSSLASGDTGILGDFQGDWAGNWGDESLAGDPSAWEGAKAWWKALDAKEKATYVQLAAGGVGALGKYLSSRGEDKDKAKLYEEYAKSKANAEADATIRVDAAKRANDQATFGTPPKSPFSAKKNPQLKKLSTGEPLYEATGGLMGRA